MISQRFACLQVGNGLIGGGGVGIVQLVGPMNTCFSCPFNSNEGGLHCFLLFDKYWDNLCCKIYTYAMLYSLFRAEKK